MTVLATTGQEAQLRDFRLLSAAVARPRASAFGEEAYPDPWVNAAALLHSLTRSHPFVDGNKRAGWNCAWTLIEVTRSGDSQGTLSGRRRAVRAGCGIRGHG